MTVAAVILAASVESALGDAAGVARVRRIADAAWAGGATPIVVVSPKPGVYWTPNGQHRRSALEKLKAQFVPAILVPEAEVAYQILALNTEKAHNLKEKSLEVIRMYRGLAEEQPRSSEEDWSFQFEAPHFITLGLVYEENKRFAGGAFAPILKRVDRFLKGKLPEKDIRALSVAHYGHVGEVAARFQVTQA